MEEYRECWRQAGQFRKYKRSLFGYYADVENSVESYQGFMKFGCFIVP
jgi:hypothetical protein